MSRQAGIGTSPSDWLPTKPSTLKKLFGFTRRTAHMATFREEAVGSIEPGKLADLVVLSADLRDATAADVQRSHVVSTYLGGELLYSVHPTPSVGFG